MLGVGGLCVSVSASASAAASATASASAGAGAGASAIPQMQKTVNGSATPSVSVPTQVSTAGAPAWTVGLSGIVCVLGIIAAGGNL